MADLDAVGNTTKAITKGMAIASAVIAAVSLFASFITDVGLVQMQLGRKVMDAIRISDTKVFIGLLLGGALPWLFSSLSIRAVTRAAAQIVEEVRAQFRIPGIMEGKVKPDYARVVGISTRSAQKELIPLAAIAVITAAAGGHGPASRGAGRIPGRRHFKRPAAGGVHGQQPAAPGTTPRNRSRTSRATWRPTPARARSGTRPAWSATPWATR